MLNRTVTLEVKRILPFMVLQKTILTLCKFRLLPLRTTVFLINKLLSNGLFRYRVDNGKWKKLKVDGHFVIEESKGV